MEFSRISYAFLVLALAAMLAMTIAHPIDGNQDEQDISAHPAAKVDRAEYLKRREDYLQRSANTGGKVNVKELEKKESRRGRRAAQYFDSLGPQDHAIMEQQLHEAAMIQKAHSQRQQGASQGARQQDQASRYSAAAAAAALAGAPTVPRGSRHSGGASYSG